MIEARYRYANEDKINYKEFNSEQEALDYLEKDPKQVVDYKFRPKQGKTNPIKNWWNNLRSTKKNWKKVRSSPYASLSLGLKARKIIVGLLIPFIAYRIWDMVMKTKVDSFMDTITKVLLIGIGVFMCWKIYETIPAAKKQIEYYKKYPHTINYVPTDTKQTVDDIFKQIKSNQEDKNVRA